MSATFEAALDPQRPFLKARVGSGVWYVTRKPRPFSLGTKDLLEAERLYDQKIGKEQPERGDVRNKDAFAAWIEKRKKIREEATVELNEGVWNIFCVHVIGGLLVQEVKKEHIQRIYREAKLRISAKTGEPISDARLRQIDNCLHAYFESMTKEPTHYRDDNPVDKVGDERPNGTISGEVSEDEVLTVDEVRLLAETALTLHNSARFPEQLFMKQMRLLIYVLAYGGMRLGEALALQQTDLLETKGLHGEWHIARQLRHRRDVGDPTTWFKKLKGKPGKIGDRTRHVPIMNAWLRSEIDAYIAEGLEAGWLRQGGLLFPSTLGRPRSTSVAGNFFRRLREACGMEAGVPDPETGEWNGRAMSTVLHHLRHTFASWLLESGEYDIEGIADLIGDTVKVCGERYAHLGDRSRRNEKAVKAMAIRHSEEPVAPAPEPVVETALPSNVIQFPGRRVA